MKAKQIGMCRGYGCAFIKLALFDVPATAPLRVTASTDAGRVPTCWRDIEVGIDGAPGAPGCSRVIVIVAPGFASGSLSLFVSSNAEYGHLTHPVIISHDILKWESRMAYRLKSNIAWDLRRQASTHSPFSDICLYFDRVIPDGDKLLLRAFIQMPFHEDSDVQLACYDFSGNPLPVELTPLSGSREPSPAAPTFFFRNQAYSMRLPADARKLLFFAIDKTHPRHMGFCPVDVNPEGALFQNSKSCWLDAAQDPAYDSWFRSKRVTGKALEAQRQVRLDDAPSFSLVVTMRNVPPDLAEATIASVRAQSYGDWELILVDAAPTDSSLHGIVMSTAQDEIRVRYMTLENDLGPTECLNLGIAASRGDYVCLLEEGDTIESDALFEYARFLQANTGTDVLYCDEDMMEPQESRFFEPHFKPGFDIDLLRSWNYIGHFACIRRSILESIMPPTAEFDGAHVYNIVLNAVERTRNVSHIGRVLYHSQFSEGQAVAAKRLRSQVEQTAVLAHLDRLGIPAAFDVNEATGVHRLLYPVSGNPLVSIIVPNKDCAAMLSDCIRSILDKTTYSNFEIVIVENNSNDPTTFDCYRQLEALDARVRVVTWPGEFNFAKIINFGASESNGSYFLLLNNDMKVIAPEWLERMLGIAQRDDVGAVGAKLLYADGTIQHAGMVLTDNPHPPQHVSRNLPSSNPGYFNSLNVTRQCTMVTGACLLSRKSAFEQVGGFTEELGVECNDVDYCLKLRDAGLVVVYEPTAVLYHFESVSRGLNDSVEKQARSSREFGYLRQHWALECVQGDPYTNPNLDPVSFALRM